MIFKKIKNFFKPDILCRLPCVKIDLSITNTFYLLMEGFLMKKLLSGILCSAMLLSTAVPVFASEQIQPVQTPSDKTAGIYEDVVTESYMNVMNTVNAQEIISEMTFDEYKSEYEEFLILNENGTIQDYENQYLDIINTSSATYSFAKRYYYHKIDWLSYSPSSTAYSKYNLLDAVKPGDILYEPDIGGGLVGHVAVVYDIATGANGRKYIRVIEALANANDVTYGVVVSALDDVRFSRNNSKILRVSNASSSQIQNALSFCIKQLGYAYNLDFEKNTSSNEKDWYCSELVWAAYYNQGIDLDGGNFRGVTPSEINKSSNTTEISVLMYLNDYKKWVIL